MSYVTRNGRTPASEHVAHQDGQDGGPEGVDAEKVVPQLRRIKFFDSFFGGNYCKKIGSFFTVVRLQSTSLSLKLGEKNLGSATPAAEATAAEAISAPEEASITSAMFRQCCLPSCPSRGQ